MNFPKIIWCLGLAAVVSALVFQSNPRLKYNLRDPRYSWLKRQIFEDKGKIFALYIGSSHTWNAVDTPMINRALSQQHSLNAAVNWAGEDAKWILARDFLEHREVRNLVFEIQSESDLTSHRYFPFLANSADCAKFTLEQLRRARRDGHAKSALELVVGAWVPQSVKGFYGLARELTWQAPAAADEDGHLAIDRTHAFGGEELAPRVSIRPDEQSVQLSASLLALADACAQKGVGLYFLCVPGHNQLLPSMAYRRALERYGQVLVLDAGQFYAAEYWADPGHLNKSGAEVYTRLLLESPLYSRR